MNKIKFAVLFAFFIFLGFAVYRGSFQSDFLKLQEITVAGASAETEARVRQNLQIHLGDYFWHSSIEKDLENIKRDPRVERVELQRQFPHTLQIIIQERKAIAVLGDSRGNFNFVDGSNVIIGKAKPAALGNLPVLVGNEINTRKDLRAQALELLKSLPDDGSLSKKDVGEIQFDRELGFQMTLTKTGTLIDIGKENIPLHVDRARRVVQYLDQHKINATRVDSDYAKKVLVKVQKAR